MSAFGGKADIAPLAKCPLMTQSGHATRGGDPPPAWNKDISGSFCRSLSKN